MSLGQLLIDGAVLALSKCSICGAQATVRHFRATVTLGSLFRDYRGAYFCDACYRSALPAEHGLSFPAGAAGGLELLCAHCLVPYSADHRCETSGAAWAEGEA